MSAKVTVYSTNHCPSCHTLKSWLESNKIPFQSVNIEEEPERQAELLRMSGSLLVPITIIERDGSSPEIVQGTQYAQIKSALGLS